MGKLTISMAIFNSYVSLPEGIEARCQRSSLASNLCSSGRRRPASPPPFPKDPKFAGWKKMKKRAESMRKLSRTGNNSNSDFLRRCFPVTAFLSCLLSFFKLFLMCCRHLCTFTCANEASSNIFTDGCFNALHAATGENPVRYQPRVNAGQHIAQHSRTVWHKLPGIKTKSWNLIGRRK